jgi:hypothetical protein
MWVTVTQLIGHEGTAPFDEICNHINLDNVERLIDLGKRGTTIMYVSGSGINVKETREETQFLPEGLWGVKD